MNTTTIVRGSGAFTYWSVQLEGLDKSPLTRGAWIEISSFRRRMAMQLLSPLTRGAWIEMAAASAPWRSGVCRPSHEGRGLKYGL